MFSSDFLAMMLKYNNDVAGFVTEKAKRKCTEQVQDVSTISMFLYKTNLKLACFVKYDDIWWDQVKVETRIEHGDPRDVICEVAEKLHVDVVVMGSHGHGLIKRLVPFNSLFKKKKF